MKKFLLEWISAFLTLSKSEQRGIIVLTSLTVMLMATLRFLPPVSRQPAGGHQEYLAQVRAFKAAQRAYLDSASLATAKNSGRLSYEQAMKHLKPFPFDPNTASDSQWIALGLSEKQAASVRRYLEKGGKFVKKEDLRKMYLISDGEYQVLEPFIRLNENPDDRKRSPVAVANGGNNPSGFITVEINSADSAQLVKYLQLKPWLAARLIKFRSILGGFATKEQLFEVYGLDSSEIMKRWDHMEIDTGRLVKIDLNNASFKALLRHPYVTYDLARQIDSLRKEDGSAISIRSLVERGMISEGDCARLRPYVIPW